MLNQLKIKQKGFTLVEIMIVVSIIGLIASVAIPNLLRARINASENTIKADLRVFSSAAASYFAAQNPPVYAPNINTLVAPPGGGPPYLDSSWVNVATRHGFNLQYAVGGVGNTAYSILATPVTPNVSAVNTYCVDQTGVIVGSVNGNGAPAGGGAGCVGGTALS